MTWEKDRKRLRISRRRRLRLRKVSPSHPLTLSLSHPLTKSCNLTSLSTVITYKPVMRSSVTCIFMSFVALVAAQSVTIDNVPAHVEYYRMPDEPLDPSFTTYTANVEVTFSELGKTGITKSSLLDQYV